MLQQPRHLLLSGPSVIPAGNNFRPLLINRHESHVCQLAAFMDAGGSAEDLATYVVGSAGSVSHDLGSDSVDVGAFSAYNALIIQNGSTLSNSSNTDIGFQTVANNNRVLVTGTSSAWNATGGLNIGFHGSSNAFTIESGASASHTFVTLGYGATSAGNTATVSGANSSWTTSSIEVGKSGQNNTFTISDGAAVTSTSNSFIGRETGSDGNQILISGENSSWRHTGSGTLHFSSGEDNTVRVSDGALLSFGSNSGHSSIDAAAGEFIILDGGYFAVQYDQTSLIESLITGGEMRLWDAVEGTSVVGGLSDFDYTFLGWGGEGETAGLNLGGYSGLAGYTLVSVAASAVPEPTAYALVCGLVSLAVIHCRRRRWAPPAGKAD